MRIPLSSSLPTTEQVILVDVSPSVCEGSPAPRSLRRASRRKDSTNEPAATQAAPRELETCFVRGVVRRDSRQSRSITYQIESAAEVSPCDVEKTQIHETPLNNSCVKDSTVKAIAVKKSPQESETSAVHGAVPARLQRPRSASGRIEAEELLSSAEPVVVHPITVATPRNQETSVKNQSKKNLSRKRCTPMEISQLMKGPPVSPQVADTRNSVRKSPMNLDDVGDLMVEVEMSFLDSSKAVQRAPMRKDCLKDDAKDGVSSSLLSEVMRCGDPNKVDDRGVLDVGAAPAPLSEPPKQPSDSQMEQTRLRAHQRKHSVRPVLDMKLHNQNLDRSTEEKCHTHPVATNEPIDERLSPRPQRHSVIDVGPIDVTSPPARLCHENPRLLPADTPKEQLHSSHNRHSPPPFHPPTPESLCPASAELSQMRTEPTAGALSTASEGLSTKPAGFVAESPPSVHLRTTPNSSGPSFAQRRDSRERSQTMPPNHSTEPFAGTDTDLRTSPEMPTVRAQPPPSVPAFQPTKRNASCCRVM
ncbi:unnamed protein product [Trypanosoma congolense IL3000]|nr:unnamed protein product [Trypanosoma congolense IL3000]